MRPRPTKSRRCASTAPGPRRKSSRASTAQQVDGVLRGQYRFAGAGQTGRLSSRGAQIQNLTRDVLGEDGAAEAALVDAIADGCSYADAGRGGARRRAGGAQARPARASRPHCRAGESIRLVGLVGDRGADHALARRVARRREGPRYFPRQRSRPDAAGHLHASPPPTSCTRDPSAVTKTERGIGKVGTLALGFGGSVGALQRMALNYRIHLDDAEARRIVDAWREANPWAREFWGAHRDGESFGLWGAAMRAWEIPGQITTAGRIAFVYREDYLGGALFMALPSGRLLTYPRPRWRDVDILDKDGKPTGEKRHELSFRRAHGRAKLWHGTFCENAIQAAAADLLRQTVTRIETNPALAFMPIRMTTHDEIVCEVDEARAEEAKAHPAARDADPAGLGRRPAAAVGGERLPLLHQERRRRCR